MMQSLGYLWRANFHKKNDPPQQPVTLFILPFLLYLPACFSYFN